MSRAFIVMTIIFAAAIVPLLLKVLGVSQVYWLFVVSEVFIFAIVAISLDLLMGRTGQISLGHAGFVALGAYTAAILNTRYGSGLLVGAVAGGFVAGVGSLVLGIPAARLRGHYLGIVTLGFGIAVDQIALKWDALTGGGQGMHLQEPTLFTMHIGTPVLMYYVSLCALVIVALAIWNLMRTRLGRAFTAIKDSEIAAEAMGVSVPRTKVVAFACSAFIAGAAGGLYAFLAGFIAPEDFQLNSSLLFFAMVILGGMGSIRGAIGGAVIVDAIKNAAATISGLSLTILGAMIVITALFFPGGLKAMLRPHSRKRSAPAVSSMKVKVTSDA